MYLTNQFIEAIPVLSYIDGGSGSMLLQAALAGAFAAAYGFRGMVGRLVASFRKGTKTRSV